MRSGAKDNQGMAAQSKWVSLRLKGLSDLIFDVIIFLLHKKHTKHALMNLEITVSISLCMRIQMHSHKTQNQKAFLYVFSFPPYYVYMT